MISAKEEKVPSALESLRVVDLSQYLAGPQVAMMLGDLGADVVRIDPPGGPRYDHPVNAMLQRGKRSITLDLKAASDLDVAQRLIRSADIVIENFRPGVAERLGVGPKAMCAENPRLIYCSLPGFGEDDPRASVRAWEGVVSAAAAVYASGTVEEDDQPVFNAVPFASSLGATVASHSVMAALIARERTGRGQRVEVPLFDALFELIAHFGVMRVGGPDPMTPNFFSATAGTSPQGGFYRCNDGQWIQLCLLQKRHVGWFTQRFFKPEWIEEGLADPEKMGAVDGNTEKFMGGANPLHPRARAAYEEVLAKRSASEWERVINEEVGAPTGLCQTTEQWLHDDHAFDSGAVVEVDDPLLGPTRQAFFPVTLSGTPPRVKHPRHLPNADREEILAELKVLEDNGPVAPAPAHQETLEAALEGVFAVDVAQVLAGPTATRLLAEYGADVVKVMSPYDGQIMAHQYTNNGKDSILLDLKTDGGRDVYLELCRDADIVQENFTLGVAERMGLGESQIRQSNPSVVYSTVSAYGHGGRRGAYRGREELGQAVTGMQLRWGGDRPRMQSFAVTDYASGNHSAFGMLVAHFHRLRGGEGQHVHTSLAHAATFHQLPFMVSFDGRVWDEPRGQDAVGYGPHDRIYRAADRWFYLAAVGAGDAARLGATEGLGDVDIASADALAAAFATADAKTWVARLQAQDLGAQVLRKVDEVMEDQVSRDLGLSLVKDFPELGPMRVIGPSGRLVDTPARPGRAVGPAGADAAVVLARIERQDELDRLIAQRVVHTELAQGTQMVGRVRINT
ncbi:MAG TPA: CoA transferase [Baekduia sp.]|nr:CoA transferase [Baekduia sp.]